MGGRKGWSIGLGLAAVVIGAALGYRASEPTASVAGATAPASSGTTIDRQISVHVAGWVISPGVVTVEEGAIVADAIAAAGGARSGAVLDAINLASPVADGGQVQVPGPGAVAPPAVISGNGEPGPLSLNLADATALQELPGVGPVLAERIVSHRESNGPFQAVEDLLDVPGIGEAKLAALRDLVTVP